MGGFGAFNIAMKHRDRFKHVVGVLPVLNLRWVDCQGCYHANFDPNNWGWRTAADNPREVLARFYHGLLKVRVKELFYPVFGQGPEAIWRASLENPIEMIDRLGIKPGDLEMYIGYAGRDEFNLDAHAESFLYLAGARGIRATVYYDPKGRHAEQTAVKMILSVIDWLAERLRAYH
jgi:S-formylglutathione hydrolase FrmB